MKHKITFDGKEIHMTVFGQRRAVITCSNWDLLKRAFKAGLVSRDPRGVFFCSTRKTVQTAALDAQIRAAMFRVAFLVALFL